MKNTLKQSGKQMLMSSGPAVGNTPSGKSTPAAELPAPLQNDNNTKTNGLVPSASRESVGLNTSGPTSKDNNTPTGKNNTTSSPPMAAKTKGRLPAGGIKPPSPS